MSESTSNGCDITTSGVPVDISHTVVLHRGHELEVCVEFLLLVILVFLWLLEAEVPEVEFKGLLGTNRSYDDKATLGRPVDGVAVLLVDGTDVTEVANGTSLALLGSEE